MGGAEAKLRREPELQAVTLLGWLQSAYPEKYPSSVRRTLERRVRRWKAEHGPAKEISFAQVGENHRRTGISLFNLALVNQAVERGQEVGQNRGQRAALGRLPIEGGRAVMPRDDLPEFPTLYWLEQHGVTRADVARRCPGAVEYGPADAPYYRREDLAALCEPERGAAS